MKIRAGEGVLCITMRSFLLSSIIIYILGAVPALAQQPHWIAEQGHVKFESTAPLEIIKAQSRSLRGVINPDSNTFAFIINVNTFKGFNNDVQQVHFLEDYLEWKKYPEATFFGKIIEKVNWTDPGTHSVRAKGNLTIHGITKERIIRGTLTVSKTGGQITTQFTVPVDDHGIIIPKIVKQKIADEILVTVNLDFTTKQKS